MDIPHRKKNVVESVTHFGWKACLKWFFGSEKINTENQNNSAWVASQMNFMLLKNGKLRISESLCFPCMSQKEWCHLKKNFYSKSVALPI